MCFKVLHRIDDLETSSITLNKIAPVLHRIDDLEIGVLTMRSLTIVLHRIDDLEKNGKRRGGKT